MSSPLVSGDQLIVEVGAETGNLVAFHKQTGRQLWESENLDEAGHTGGPVPISVEGADCVAVVTLRNLVVTRIDGSTAGSTVAEFPWTTDFANNIATPVVFRDSVIITSAYNHYAMCRVNVTLKGATKVWENKELASGVCSPLIHWAWRGVHCLDFATGKELWSGGNVGSQGSCILTSDDRLIVYSNKGELSLVETAKRSAKEYTQLAAKSVLSETDAWPHVVLSNGRLICRDRSGSVRCLAVSAEPAQ
jgi:outer membrane protein assembly factor BamB